jgi:uncharacterized protein YdhG (YjbR/CyaY superfamily)
MATSDSSGFSEVERAAMKERAREAREFKKLPGEEQVQNKIAEMSPDDQKLARGIHDLVLGVSPDLTAKTWYGMPAYYFQGKVICFFQAGSKFESRYCTFGFQDSAKLDDGPLWPTSYAITELTDEVSNILRARVKQAIS